MAGWRGAGAVLALLTTGGCAVVSPLVDRDMSKAPHRACAFVQAPIADRPCFLLAEEDAAGARRVWGGGRLTPGRTLVAVYRPGEACNGRFTHLTVTGAADGAGGVTLSVWDALGRTGHGRAVRWRQGFAERRLTLASIDSATLHPAGARVGVDAGDFTPTLICFAGY